MKKITILLLNIYQVVIAPLFKSFGIYSACRFTPSCSEYMKEMIYKHDFVLGFKKGLAQLLSCHPKGKYGANI